MKRSSILALIVSFSGLSMASCGPSDFDPETLINSVRVMGSQASEPYAAPGDAVDLQVLAYDNRPQKSAPMKIYWLPVKCENPTNDAYYGCFAAFASALRNPAALAGDAGAPIGCNPVGGDLTGCLPTGPSYRVTVPADAITAHPAVQGANNPYGLVIVFNMACAGHVQVVPRDSNNPQQVPISCFDDNGVQLTPDDYVFGYTRVYAYAKDGGAGTANTNPVISDVKINGQIIDPHVGFVVQHSVDHVDVDIDIPDGTSEITDQTDTNGAPLHEQIYASYYGTVGKMDDEVRVIYDPVQGAIDDHHTKFEPGDTPGDGFMWIVLHDNRDGASWVQVPIHIQ